MSAPLNRRGWCPGTRRPMETGDGLLVRIHPPGGVLKADQARLIAQAAQAYGNGLLDVTARGNLQIRGVSDESYPPLLGQLDEMGLVEPDGVGPHRLTVVSPLAGLDPHDCFDALSLAEAVEGATNGLADLPPKTFIAVDGGGCMPLDGIGADLHLKATGADEVNAVAFGLASQAGLTWIGATSLALAPETAASILSRFAAMRREGHTEARRVRELAPDLAQEIAAAVPLHPCEQSSRRSAHLRAGLIELSYGKAALLAALPFGRCTSQQLASAAGWSERYGTGEIRLSFTRGVLFPGITLCDAEALADEASRAGFMTVDNDPRLALVACPGKPACGSAWTPAPDDAVRLVDAAALLTSGATVHVSGCPKGCAHPGSASLTLVGGADSTYGVVVGGTSRDPALVHLSIEEIMTRLSSVTSPADLDRAFQEGKP